MNCGRAICKEARATRKYSNIVLILQEKQFFTSELFKVIQDATSLILHYKTLYQFPTISSSTFITSDVQSIYIPSRIQDWYREANIWAKDWQYLFFLLVNPVNKEHQDPETIDLISPRLARYLQTAWKEHQNTVYWVDFKLAQKKGLRFYQTQNFLRHDWMKELGSEVAGHGESSQQTQPKTTNPSVKTGRPVSTEQPSSSSAQEIDKRFLLDCESTTVFVERLEKKQRHRNKQRRRCRSSQNGATRW